MQYQTEKNGKGGFRFNVQNPPAVGTKFRNQLGETVTFDEIGLAGMLACTGPNGQALYMPDQLTEVFDADGMAKLAKDMGGWYENGAWRFLTPADADEFRRRTGL